MKIPKIKPNFIVISCTTIIVVLISMLFASGVIGAPETYGAKNVEYSIGGVSPNLECKPTATPKPKPTHIPPTAVPPTPVPPTPVPPTAVPPTAIPEPTATPEPTAVPPTAIPPTAIPEPTATSVPNITPRQVYTAPKPTRESCLSDCAFKDRVIELLEKILFYVIKIYEKNQ